jgi:2-polyprenyl-6-methoxyphenol hydroxylase-like FAD-dependent oxidoreductase
MRAVIIGGSIGGLFTANMLERAGWDVVVVERTAEQLSARGAGVVTHPELFDDLTIAGVSKQDLAIVHVDRRITFGTDGSKEYVLDFPQGLVAWGELHQYLSKTVRTSQILRGAMLTSFQDTEAGVLVQLADGRSMMADLLIGADGFRSTVRRLLLPSEQIDYAGYAAWRGLVSEDDLDGDVAADLMSCFAFGFPKGEQIVGYPVAKPDAEAAGSARQFNYVWYRPAADMVQLEAMLTDAQGNIHRDGIPPHLLRSDVLAQMRADALRVLSPQLAAAVRATRQPLLQPIYDYAASRFAVGRVALVGDAAVVARPHCGMGVTKAGSDAAALLDALSAHPGDVRAALQLYDEVRRPLAHALMHHAQDLGNTIGDGKSPAPPPIVRKLMQEIAVAPQLHGAN